jgi:hypothetical protein
LDNRKDKTSTRFKNPCVFILLPSQAYPSGFFLTQEKIMNLTSVRSLKKIFPIIIVAYGSPLNSLLKINNFPIFSLF